MQDDVLCHFGFCRKKVEVEKELGMVGIIYYYCLFIFAFPVLNYSSFSHTDNMMMKA